MRVAYADPPYVGQAKKHYGTDEIDHEVLVATLLNSYDSWVLSCSSPSLRFLLPLCPDGIRVAAWVKPFCSFKPGVNPAYAWEPVLFWGARKRSRDIPTVRDWLSANITLRKGLAGVKPEAFCFWLFELMGWLPADEFHDLYPGSGIVGKCWNRWEVGDC